MNNTCNTNQEISDYLKELHLPTIKRLYEDNAMEANRESLSYQMYLYGLLQKECEVRHNNKVERLLRESRLPLEKDLASFDLKRLPSKISHVVNTLLDGTFLDRKENILAFGNPGSGKTHLLSAIALELIQQFPLTS